MKVALLVQRYEKEMDSAQNEMITFFAADDQDPCKDCGRKHPEESGCTRRKLLEGTLQKLGPLAAQVKKIRAPKPAYKGKSEVAQSKGTKWCPTPSSAC